MNKCPTSSIPLFPGLGPLLERPDSWSTTVGHVEGISVDPRVQGLAKCSPQKNPDTLSYLFNLKTAFIEKSKICVNLGLSKTI